MEQRKLGKTDHMSSLLTLGGSALPSVTQAEADAAWPYAPQLSEYILLQEKSIVPSV